MTCKVCVHLEEERLLDMVLGYYCPWYGVPKYLNKPATSCEHFCHKDAVFTFSITFNQKEGKAK